MPLLLPPLLRQMIERANPAWCDIAEVSQADVGQVFRRWADQLSITPPRVSETPTGSTQGSASGGMQLKATMGSLVSIYTDSIATKINLDVPNPAQILDGVTWQLADNLQPVRLHQVKVKLSTDSYPPLTNVELQIYRMRGMPGSVIRDATGRIITQYIQRTPTPLLNPPARVNAAQYSHGANATSDFLFDLSPYMLDVEHRNVPAPSMTAVGEDPELLFEVYVTEASAKGHLRWQVDLADGAPTFANIGRFVRKTWEKRMPNGTLAHDYNDPRSTWVGTEQTQCPCIEFDVDTYPATSQAVYAITLARTPNPAAVGRVVFRREEPVGTSLLLELATAGATGPWTAVKSGDIPALAQATYWLRATLNASSDLHRTPVLDALGVEYRIPMDLSAEGTITPLNVDVNTPFLDSAIGEGKIAVVRTGRRDYHDPASDLLTASAATQLELDHYIASRHPKVTRDAWFHLNRAIVTSGEPAPTAETLSTISYLKVAKKKIPIQKETVNQVMAVASSPASTPTTIFVPSSPGLPGTSVGGHEYNGLHYYIRIVSTAVAGLAPGMDFPVIGSTGTTQLDMGSAPGLPAALAAGDTFELHSQQYQQTKLQWANADPAAIWNEIFTVHLAIPKERLGLAALGRATRAGLPPTLADRAPGDTATQAKLQVSNVLTQQVDAKSVIDALSFLMQGTTIEIEGQIVFVNMYDLLDPNGNPVLPPPEVAATFDQRDYYNLQTPRGLESRVSVMSCAYGVDASLGQDAAAPSTVVFADGDAVSWFTQQDLEDIGNSAVKDDIAAWCYNSADGGAYLAQVACRQVVRACSTGMRVWPFRAVDIHPELVPGDRVVVLTDQYTDFDPTNQVAIRGLWAFPLVLVHVADRGRDLRGYMLGLASAVDANGGSGTLAVGLVGQPSIGNISFDASGNLLVSLNMGTPPGSGFRIAASMTGMPTDATVDATAFIPGTTAAVNLGGGWAAGVTVQIKTIAYASSNTAGPRSLPSTVNAKAPGGTGATATVTQGAPDYTANSIPLTWSWSGPGPGAIASENVWVSEAGRGFALWLSGLLLQPVTFDSDFDLVPSGGNFTDNVVVYVEGVDSSGHVVARSQTSSVSYSANR